MTQINIKERIIELNSAIQKNLDNSINKSVHLGNITFITKNYTCSVIVETDCKEYVGDFIRDLIRKSKHGVVMSVEHYEGVFDWKSDTYIKPYVEVIFSI